jgi:hypothetical protein
LYTLLLYLIKESTVIADRYHFNSFSSDTATTDSSDQSADELQELTFADSNVSDGQFLQQESKIAFLGSLSIINCPNLTAATYFLLPKQLVTICIVKSAVFKDEILETVLTQCRNLKSLSLIGCPNVTFKTVSKKHALRELKIDECGIDGNSFKAISWVFYSLTHFALSSCPDVDSDAFCELRLPKGLRSLDLSNTAIKDDTITRVLDSIATNCLKHLDLSYCNLITTEWFRKYRYSKNLETFYAAVTEIDVLGVKWLLKSCPRLLEIELKNCPNLAIRGFQEAVSRDKLKALAKDVRLEPAIDEDETLSHMLFELEI